MSLYTHKFSLLQIYCICIWLTYI